MEYSISEILTLTDSKLLNKQLFPGQIEALYFDTRKGIYGNQALFLAIDGKNADGHQYIAAAYENLHTRHFLVSKKIDFSAFPEANFLYTSDVIHSLQKLAIHHRNQFQLDVMGITGSNGKTIVKEWIFQLCEHERKIVRSPGSYNSQIGVPLSVLKIDQEHDLAIFEAGISGKNEMSTLAGVIKPDIGIFTNIGEAHSAGFQSLREKIKEKAKLFKTCHTIIYCKDHQEIDKELSTFKNQLITWSTKDQDAHYFVSYAEHSVVINGITYPIPFNDDLSKENATVAIVAALVLGIPNLPTESLTALKMRLEMKQGINNSFLINDAYNSDFNALASALKILEQQQKKGKNTLILSQIEETKLDSQEVVTRVADMLSRYDLQRVITVGNQLQGLPFEGTILHFEDTKDLLNSIDQIDFHNENILIKGARKYSLEQIFDRLSVKVHQTILEIDLEAMRHNLMIYRSLLKADTRLMVVLKASGYGSGSKELSRFLSYQRVDYIAVAYVDEGIELRKSGIDTPIMVMNPEESGFASMIRYQLEPEIYSLDQLKIFETYLNKTEFPIHLKIETGMHRLGIEEEDLEDLCQFLVEKNWISVATIFSHLVGSDDPSLDDFSRDQATQFLKAYELISSSIGYQPIRHIVNSNGISRFPEYQFEMVRLGIGLHGLSDDPNLKKQLQKVQTLKTRIAQIKSLKPGETVGYNRRYKATRAMKIGTINIGYADGLPRNAGNGRYTVLLNGKHAVPIVGNVCMDMCMIDLTEVIAEVGDEVIIFGRDWPIERLAQVCGTIPYEILTRLSTRIHRIFSRE